MLNHFEQSQNFRITDFWWWEGQWRRAIWNQCGTDGFFLSFSLFLSSGLRQRLQTIFPYPSTRPSLRNSENWNEIITKRNEKQKEEKKEKKNTKNSKQKSSSEATEQWIGETGIANRSSLFNWFSGFSTLLPDPLGSSKSHCNLFRKKNIK